jgi:zeaxanthin glucosyltransferase
LKAEQIGHLPRNAIVAKHVPQVELLKRSVLCVTHAGLNTALECLTYGVPMVAIPMTNDQPGLAARLRFTKTGTYRPPQQVTGSRLRGLIDDVLSNPVYHRSVTKLRREIEETSGLNLPADIVEAAFRTVRSPGGRCPSNDGQLGCPVER